jgi:EAL domain-containing protein (putative c-di-GMP-specific phosphodiesterase class I)/ActR/RegA family two-component response regulator
MSMKTLLIDDDPFALKLLARQLELLGCVAVTQCERAQDALALLEAKVDAFGLVFCDLQMPDIDGVEFVRHLSRIGYRGKLVLVSGEDGRILQTAQKLARAHRLDIVAALAKPVSNEQLRKVLANTATRRPAVRHASHHAHAVEDLRRAITGGELVNHYQPKIEMAAGALIGVEALVRWKHPTAGLVFPDEFISIAESHGLIDALTHAVLAAALRQTRLWRDAGLELQIAVNVSMDNLTVLDFPDVVAQMANDAGVALSSLMLEVTESRLMKDVRAPLETLTRLRLKRIGLSIDDFGTGHSSLAQLRDIPFDELKLDRSFVTGAARDPALRAIVENTLAMAHHLGIKTVAEGVEDRADWDFLRTLGCDVAQGYFIARPMPGTDLLPWLAAWTLRHEELMPASV